MNLVRPAAPAGRFIAAFAGLSGLLWAFLFAPPLAALEQSETVTRSFTLAAVSGQRTLVVDNVSGSIDIEAASGDTVQLTLKQTYIARNAAEMARARQEVVLEVTEDPGRLELVQGGPWRCRSRDKAKHGDCCCGHDDRDDRRRVTGGSRPGEQLRHGDHHDRGRDGRPVDHQDRRP